MFRGSDLPDMKWLPFFVITGVVSTVLGSVAFVLWMIRVFYVYFTAP